MIVNDAYGNFYCVDDSFGTVNPTIEFNNPPAGAYDVGSAATPQARSSRGLCTSRGTSAITLTPNHLPRTSRL
jgi:hypothetical protein